MAAEVRREAALLYLEAALEMLAEREDEGALTRLLEKAKAGLVDLKTNSCEPAWLA
jgi:hypothetical protein